MEAQSKPEDYKRSEPQPDYPVGGTASPVGAKRIAARASEQGWTTAPRNSQKRLPAPAAAVPVAPVPKVSQAPARASFLADKPPLQVPQGLEPPTMVFAPVLVATELCQPRLTCKLDELQASQPPLTTGLLELVNPPAFAKPEARPVAAEAVLMRHSRPPIRIDFALSTRSIPGFAAAELLPFQYDAGRTRNGKWEPELQPAYNFDFQPILGHAGTIVDSAPAQASDAITTPQREGRLHDLLPLHIRPSPVGSRYRTPWPAQIPMRTFQPEFPNDIPLILRPHVAASDPVKVVSGVPALGKAPQARAASASEDLPSFLQGLESAESEKSVWGSVQRYLKNIVGCLLFAILGGGYFGDASATKVLSSANVRAELSGESDRAKPERQIFVYPASLGLQDYRVDFEAPLSAEGTVWVFRVVDPRNYYGMRLAPQRDGADVRWVIQKYLEVNGEQVLSGTVRLNHTPQSPYCRITLEVEGSQFRTYVQGLLVDRWTDARFSRGGFGYHGGTGGALPIRAVRVGPLEPADRPRVDRRG